MKILLKKYWYLFLLSLIVISLFLLKVFSKNTSSEVVIQKTEKKSPYITIAPTLPASGFREFSPILEEQPAIRRWPTITLKDKTNGELTLTKEFYPESKTFSDFTNLYGQYDNLLYGADASADFFIYTFLKNGVALIANENSGRILEIWNFQPTTLENFLKLWGKDLSIKEPHQF